MWPKLDLNQVLGFLSGRGLRHLFHANTAETSLSFLAAGELLTRAEVPRRALPQTPQKSDSIDNKFGLLDTHWFNTTDFHVSFQRPNAYGPVLFRANVARLHEFLKTSSTASIAACIENPIKWREELPPHERWLSSFETFKSNFKDPTPSVETAGYLIQNMDLVIDGISAIPLSVFDDIVVDSNIFDAPNFFTDFKSRAQHFVTGKPRLQVWARNCFSRKCACKSEKGYEAVKETLAFGKWPAPPRKTA